MEPSTARELWGGACRAAVPGRYRDVSEVREVPDACEAFSDPAADESLIFELIETDPEVADADAARVHFQHLARSNEAASAELHVADTAATPSAAPRVDPGRAAPTTSLARGTQVVGKYRDDAATKGNAVEVHVAVVRLPSVSTDLVVSLTRPTFVNPASAAAKEGVQAGARPADVAAGAVTLAAALASFEVLDWGLFGSS